MHKLTGSCNQCGMCCKAIVLPVSFQKLRDMSSVRDYINGTKCEDIENDDVLFVWLNWKPITKEEAFEINPYLKEWEEGYLKEDSLKRFNFWTCTKHDLITNKCTVHDHRPHVCSDFPWYGRDIQTDGHFYTPECGYKIDVIQAQNLLALEEKEVGSKSKFLDNPIDDDCEEAECLDEKVDKEHD